MWCCIPAATSCYADGVRSWFQTAPSVGSSSLMSSVHTRPGALALSVHVPAVNRAEGFFGVGGLMRLPQHVESPGSAWRAANEHSVCSAPATCLVLKKEGRM